MISVENIVREQRGKEIFLSASVRNGLERHIYAIAAVRRLHVDFSSRTLNVFCGEPPGDLTIAQKQGRPERGLSFIRVPPGESHPVAELTLPAVATRISITQAGRPILEPYDLTALESVDFHFGWNDVPFYPDPRAPHRGTFEQLEAWQQGVARAAWRRPPGDSR